MGFLKFEGAHIPYCLKPTRHWSISCMLFAFTTNWCIYFLPLVFNGQKLTIVTVLRTVNIFNHYKRIEKFCFTKNQAHILSVLRILGINSFISSEQTNLLLCYDSAQTFKVTDWNKFTPFRGSMNKMDNLTTSTVLNAYQHTNYKQIDMPSNATP